MAYQKVQNLSGYISLHLLLLQSFVLVSTLVLLLNPPYVRGRSPESLKSEGSSTPDGTLKTIKVIFYKKKK